MAGLTCEFPRVIREGVCRTSHYRGRLEISHAIPCALAIVIVRKAHDFNDLISKVKTVERELHAKLVRRREISSGSLASCRDMLTSCIKRTSTRRTDTCMHKRPRPHTRPGPFSQPLARLKRITRRRRWGASCRRGRPTRRTPRRSGSPARGRTRAATGPCDARSSRSWRPCRSRCGGSGPSPA